MRPFIYTLGLVIGTSAFADDFKLNSSVTSAVVFGQGGSITRSADLSMPAGVHRLILQENAAIFFDELIEFQFPTGSGVEILSSQILTDRIVKDITVDSADYVQAEANLVAAEKALAEFDLRIAAQQAEVIAANAQITFLESLADGKAGVFPEDGAVAAGEVQNLVETIGAEMAKATQNTTRAQQEIKAAQRERQKLSDAVNQALAALNAASPIETEIAEVVLDVRADAAFQGSLEITYITGDVRWEPRYRADVSQEGDKGSLSLQRRAMLYQATEEDWKDVRVVLSTANIIEKTDSFLPRPEIRRLIDPPVALQRKSVTAGARDSIMSMESAPVAESFAAPSVDASGFNVKGQTLEFTIPELVSLRHDPQNGSVFEIDEIEADVSFYARANAARDKKAYLYTDFENKTDGMILAGQAALYRDGALVGVTQIPQIVADDEVELPLGPIDGITIERRTVSREDGDRGLITTSNARSVLFETTISSLVGYNIDLRLFDNIPVSESEDLVIKETLRPAPTERGVEGKRGVLRWDFTLGAGDEIKVQNGHTMTWPTDKIIR